MIVHRGNPGMLLVASSLGFLLPAIVMFHDDDDTVTALELILGFGAVITCLASVNAWRHFPDEKGFVVDKLVARTSCALFTVVGLAVIPWEALLEVGFPTWVVMAVCFGMSQLLKMTQFMKQAGFWAVAHAGFHLADASGMCLVIAHA